MQPFNPEITIYYRASQQKASSSIISLKTLRKYCKKMHPSEIKKITDSQFYDTREVLFPFYEYRNFDIPTTRYILCNVFFHHLDFIDQCMGNGLLFGSFFIHDGRMIVTLMEERRYNFR